MPGYCCTHADNYGEFGLRAVEASTENEFYNAIGLQLAYIQPLPVSTYSQHHLGILECALQ
jgi:hypothetical protein